jgi:preprotein translocase subunit YajC
MPGGYGILSWVLIIGVFYVFLIMPERRKQKNMKSMIESLKLGDSIITRGGIYGTIVSLVEDRATIETGPDRVKIEMSKFAISSITKPAETVEKDEAAVEKVEEQEKTE